MHQLILASASPRRLELLQSVGIRCTVDTVKVSEIIDENLNLEDALQAVARDKARTLVAARNYPKGKGILVLAGDTIVVLGQQPLGKPRDKEDASEILRRLSGQEHRVMTGLCVYEVDTSKSYLGLDTTWVRFRDLSEIEIQNYVKSGEPMDKAGAYGIQGAGGDFVIERRGSWSNVVGLPLELLERMIRENDWRLPRD